MKLRKATLNDLNILVNYKIDMFKDAGVYELLSEDCRKKILSTYRELYICDKAIHYVIEEDDLIVSMSGGFIKNDIPYCFFETDYYGFIGDMYTLSNYRRRGYSKLLLEKTVDWLRYKDVKQVKLLTSSDGRHMYENFGFEQSTDEMILYLK